MSVARMQEAKESFQKAVALSLICVSAFKHELFDIGHVSTKDQLLAVAYLGGVIVVFIVLERLIDAKIDCSRVFRILAMGSDNIEGVWIDIVRDNGGIKCGALITICYHDDRYVVSGEEYFADGKIGGAFTTTVSLYKNRRIDYIYEGTESSGQSSTAGRGHYEFSGFKCMHFIGKFINDDSHRHYEVRGVRLSSVFHELPAEDLRGVSGAIVNYYKKGLRRKLLRIFNSRPAMTITEKKILTVAIIKYFERFLVCKN